MYDTSTGRWMSVDPSGFAAGDANLYRYVGNEPTNLTDPSGLAPGTGWAKPIEDTGVGQSIANGKADPNAGWLVKAKGIMGESFKASSKDGKRTFTFTFEKAYVGKWDEPRFKRQLQGVYVNVVIAAAAPSADGDWDKVQTVQIVRDITYNGRPTPDAIEPDVGWKSIRSGWDNPASLSRSWRVDALPKAKDAFYPYVNNKELPITTYDAPGVIVGGKKSTGREFYTCLVGYDKNNTATFLGCVHWGLYVDKDGKVEFDGKPTASPDAPPALGDSIGRWNNIEGNRQVPSIDGVDVNNPPPKP